MVMTNPPIAQKLIELAGANALTDSDKERADLAGTRMLIAEECFDAMLQMLIDVGAVPRSFAAVMLDRLAERLLLHASGRTDTQWAIRAPELLDQATRLSTIAAGMRVRGRRP